MGRRAVGRPFLHCRVLGGAELMGWAGLWLTDRTGQRETVPLAAVTWRRPRWTRPTVVGIGACISAVSEDRDGQGQARAGSGTQGIRVRYGASMRLHEMQGCRPSACQGLNA